MFVREDLVNDTDRDVWITKKYRYKMTDLEIPKYVNRYGYYHGLPQHSGELKYVLKKRPLVNYFYKYIPKQQIPNAAQLPDTDEPYTKLHFKYTQRNDYDISNIKRYSTRKLNSKYGSYTTGKKAGIQRSNYKDIVDNVGLGIPNVHTGNIHHYTEEYYLSYLTRHYDFSLTHNDLLSIEKNHIPIVIDKMNEYFEKIDQDLKLEHIEVIDHNIYRNKLFIFAFSKVFIKAKMHSNTDSTTVYITELVAFSKYPDNKELVKMVSDVSKIIYDSLIEQDLDINCRLIDTTKEPENNMVFTRLYGNAKEYNTTDVSISNMVFKEFYYPYLNVKLLQEEFSKSLDKLLILYGENGSGKTKLSNILALHLQNENYDIVVVSGSDIEYEPIIQGIESRLYDSINKSRNICIVIDDIDPSILNREREGGGNVFFNKLLTITDGNLDLKFKFIITTNHIIQKEQDFPLYRSGRLFDCIYIRYLTQDEAKSILKENKVDTKSINEFLSKQGEKVKQSDVAQFIHFANNKITKAYYLDKKPTTKIKTNRVGLV